MGTVKFGYSMGAVWVCRVWVQLGWSSVGVKSGYSGVRVQ